ncbi:MAG: hypothetical protein E7659_02520 [Ruminococcaceae bacterium]|nr:hypothetical protein [Oscillospiraceae bacterium]
MKKILVVLLTLILCVSTLASCDFLKNFAEIRDGETTTTTEEGTTVPPVDNPPVEEYNVQAAADYVYNLYKNKTVTATDFEVTSKVSILGTIHTVEWSVDTDKVTIEVKDENTYIVNVDEESPEELAYVLTATIKGGDETATKSFNLTVPEYMLTPFEEYIDMTEGNVVVKGIVVGINSKAAGNTRNHLFLADLDGKGGYYSYQMDADPVADLGIEVGMIVEVSGPVSPYSGMQEIKGGVARIVDSTIHEFDIVDITEAFANGSSLKNYVGTLVTIKGVEITGQELGGTSDYLKFKLNNKEAYVRTYVTDFPTTLVKDDKATIDAAHLEHFGWTANATGILVLYNSNPYLIPVGVDCFEYLNKVEKSNEEMIADVMNQLKLGTSYTSNAVVELPVAVYPEVVLTWASNNEALVAIADGKLTITVPDAATDVIVTVTATCGDKTATKEFTLKLSKTAESIKDIIDLGASKGHNQYTEEKHLVAGIISEVYNTTYGNMKIVDEFGNVLTIYGTYSADGSARYDAMENAPVAGDYVVIFGIVGQYNGTPQVKNGWIMSITKPTSVKDAIDTGASMEHNTYTEGKVVVTGVITEVYNTTYGNMRITDAEGNILTIYGTYSSTGANRYDAIEGAPVAGDTVTIYGILGQYNGTPQIKNGWIVAVTKGSDTPECTEHVDADGDKKCDVCGADMPNDNPPAIDTPAPDSTLSVKDAIDFALTQEHNVFTEGKYYVTGVIKEVYNDMYGNMRIVDEAGNVLTLYGTYNADGTVRYDALEVKPVAGDTITVYGIIGQYNGTPQVKNGWIVKHTAAETPDLPECKEHVDADGDEKCDVCGADVPKVEEPKDPAADSTLTVEEVIALGASKEHNTYTEGKYYVTGVIVEVYQTVYGNMKIQDEAGNILTIYGTYSADGTVRYDALEVKPVAGDTVTIYGIVGQYNGTPQIKNGWIVKHTAAETPDLPECTEHVDADGDEKCDVCGADVPAAQPPVEGSNTVTGVIADIAKANGWANGTMYESFELNSDIIVSCFGTAVNNYGRNTGKYYTSGENWRIYQAEKPEVTITALNGKTIVSVKITYASQNTGTLTLNGEAVASGTVVTVNATSITFSVGNTGAATNGQARITAIEVVYAGGNDTPACEHAEEIIPASPATCTETGLSEGKKCSKCGEILVEQTIIAALGHTFVEGKCTVCGAEDPDYVKPDEPKAEWTLVTELKDGDHVLIGAPAYGKLLSALKVSAGSYYNKGVDYSADNFANVTDAEIFVVTVNEDGSYTFTSLTGDVIALADSYSSLNVTGAHKSWTLKSNGDGTFLVYNTGRKTYLEWYNSKGNWSTYTAGNTAEYYLSFYVKTSDSGETPDPECKHTNTVVEGATEATCNTAGFTGNTVCTDCKAVIANGEEIPATGKHTFEEGKCTVCGAEDPDYVKPDAPAAGGSADFNTIEGKGSSSYASATTASGWEISNSAIQVGGPNVANPAFPVIGPDNTYKAVCLNGKVSAPGKIVSPTLTGGISKLTINYTKMFTDTALSVTVTITDANGNTYTHVIEATLDKNEKYVVYTDEWVLDTPITGDFTIEIVNNSPTQNTGNKDRFTILDISWN